MWNIQRHRILYWCLVFNQYIYMHFCCSKLSAQRIIKSVNFCCFWFCFHFNAFYSAKLEKLFIFPVKYYHYFLWNFLDLANTILGNPTQIRSIFENQSLRTPVEWWRYKNFWKMVLFPRKLVRSVLTERRL